MKIISARPRPAVSRRRPVPSQSLEILFTLLILLATVAQQAVAQGSADKVMTFDIPAQSLEGALLQFSRQAEVQVMVAGDVLKGHNTQALKGTLSTRVALARLLQNAGLDAEFRVSDATVTVKPASAVEEAVGSKDRGSQQPVPPPSDKSTAPQPLGIQTGDRSTGAREEPRARPLEEVVVTGTHIPGLEPVGTHVHTLERGEIDASGLATVQDVLRSLPENFGGGANEGTGIGGGPNINSSFGSSVNLRGLGPGATLVLLNGRRLSPAGGDASFVDVSSIPLAAVERIDVLPDGASAIYGSDALAGVVNVVLRKDFAGAETRAHVAMPTEAGADGYVAAQTFGTRWSSGSALLSYEYYRREELPARDRALTASMDLRAFGGTDFRVRNGNPGTIVIGAQTWAIPTGQDGGGLTAASLVAGTSNLFDQNETRDLLPEQTRHGAFGTLSQEISDHVRVFVDGLYSHRTSVSTGPGFAATIRVPNTNPFYVHPTSAQTPVPIAYNFVNDLGPTVTDIFIETIQTTAGSEFRAPGDWLLTLAGVYSRERIDQLNLNRPNTAALNAALADANPATAFNAFGDGSFTSPATLSSIRASSSFDSDSTLSSGDFAATGPLAALPGGDLMLAVGTVYSKQEFDSIVQLSPGGATFLVSSADRDVTSAFTEFRIPIFSGNNRRTGLERLAVSLAARHEDYSDFGSATLPRVGFEWSPAGALTLRSSWGRSFKAPNLPNLDEANNGLFITSVPDPQAPMGISPVLVWQGQNSDLQEERATTWAAGFDVSSADSGRRLSLTYFHVDFEDRIQMPAFSQAYLTDPQLADFVIRAPTAAQRQDACARGTFFGVAPADCVNAPVAALLDLRARNTAITEQRGVDFSGVYSFAAGGSQMSVGLSGTYLLDLRQAQLPTSPLTESLNTPLNPVDLRMRGSLTWRRAGLSAAAFVNYTDSYRDTVSVPNRKIGSWTTVDVQAAYDFGESTTGLLGDASVALNVHNALDEDPSFFNNAAGVGYDPTNATVIGRTVSLQLRKKW